MSLSKIQFDLALKRALVKHLKTGEVPSLTKVTKLISNRLKENYGKETMYPPVLTKNGKLDLRGLNKELEALDFDINVLQSFLFSEADSALRRVVLFEILNSIASKRASELEQDMSNLSYILGNGDQYFDSFFDSFNNFSKVNQESTTPNSVDISTGSVTLPDSLVGSSKINLQHLYKFSSVPLQINVNDGVSIVSAMPASDAPFKNLFTATLGVWRHDIITNADGPVEVSFTIPLSDDSRLVLVSKVEIYYVDFSQKLEILYSQDNVNFLSLDNNRVRDLSKFDGKLVIEVSPLLAKFIKIILYKDNNDKIVDNKSIYSFSLQEINLYSVGKASRATLVSKKFEPESLDRLSEISITCDEELPKGTDIKYYIGAFNKDKIKEFDGYWSEITPLNRNSNSSPKILKLTSKSNKTATIIPINPLTPDFSYRGTDFYNINSTEIEDTIIDKSARIHRGKNSWQRVKNNGNLVFNVSSEYISFSSTPRQKLYAVSNEVLFFSNVLTKNGTNRSTVEVSRPIDYRPDAGITLTPPPNVDPYSVPDPIHSIYSLKLVSKNEEYTENITFGSSLTKGIKFSSGPIKIEPTEETTEFLTAYNIKDNTVHETLIAQLHGRPSLSSYHNKIVRNIINVTTPQQIANGEPNISKITIGNHSSATTFITKVIEGEVIASSPKPKNTTVSLSTLTDSQLLDQFGRITLKSSYVTGIVGYGTANSNVYYPNIDFSINIVEDPVTSARDVYVTPTPSTSISASETVQFKFKYKEDLMENVIAVVGNRIYLDKEYPDLLDTNKGFKIDVGYRYIPVGINKIYPDTVKAYSSIDKLSEYEINKDFVINSADGTIVLLNSSLANSPFYIDFDYSGPTTNLEIFRIHCLVENKEPFSIEYNDLDLDSSIGEKFILASPEGTTFDISTLTKTPIIKNGWYTFIVYSKSPDTYSGAAIYKIAALLDKKNVPVFISQGQYFTYITGTRYVMTPVSLNYLKNVISDKEIDKFAIDGDKVIINFKPNSQEDFFTYGIVSQQSSGNIVSYTTGFRNEELSFSYDYIPDEEDIYNAFVLRAELIRSSEASGATTPKLNGYSIRIR